MVPDIRVMIDNLRGAVEAQHGGRAMLVQTVPVRESFQGQPVWEGVVHTFDLEGHPCLCMVLGYRGERQAAVLCRAGDRRYHVAPGCGAGCYRGGASDATQK